ncbi:MFS general substrate transporter [Dendrothele bispora CBS 962.96]|uniref:MFS general substrate transporter n=1 Tax=Dendrothele bispora (strain CBS 962.96) TaxID=1314807 RepID=A0A4S8MVM0_DENBC|nr:MFS general substrate transporter [Dendrothele bispora CBS 962.96]
MTFGILEDKHLKDVPGTALLSDLGVVHGQQVTIDEAGTLKRGTGRHAHVILVPQPSDDPADPLNWPRWKKEACFWTLAFAASLDGALSPMVGPGYVLLSSQFGVSVDEVASSFGAILLGLACFMLLQGSLAVKFGHRIVYLFSVTLMFISCIWCAVSPNMASIRASRVFQGFGMSALQSLVASTIEQIYFVHERGNRSVIWSFSIMSGITLGPLLYSYVVQNLSWQMGFWFVSIPLGIAMLLVFFFVPETTYRRPDSSTNGKSQNSPVKPDNEKTSVDEHSISAASENNVTHKPSYLSQLKIWHGTFSDESLFKIFLRPFPFLLSPVTIYIFLVHGMQTVWLSLLPICSSTIFTIEYGFNASQIGLTNLGGIVGIVLATAITGPLTDWGTIWLSKRNKGIYEPEFRIFFISTMLMGTFGYAGWAVGTTHNMPWIGAVACLALANFSMVTSGSAAVTYLLDTHGPNALHVLALSNFFKNIVLYSFTFFANGMVESRGVRVSLLILAGCQTFCWLGSTPMYVFGKRIRSWIARHPQLFAGERKEESRRA